jgi:hypothetical protein
MALLPDFDALGLERVMMFEKANPRSASQSPRAAGPRPGARPDERAGPARRAGDALRAVEWSDITARLNAARDLRLLLRTESQAPIEAVAASFGDAAASYFALLQDNCQPGVNPVGLGQSKALSAMLCHSDANRPGDANGASSDADRDDAREMQ